MLEKQTSMKKRLFSLAASKTCFACFKFMVTGFSQSTCLPAFKSLIDTSAWHGWLMPMYAISEKQNQNMELTVKALEKKITAKIIKYHIANSTL